IRRSSPCVSPRSRPTCQLLLVGFEGTEAERNQAVERLLCETRVGGVVLFARNITGDEQAGRLTRALAERARACTGRPLLIAVDAEAGRASGPAPGSPPRSPPGSPARGTASRPPSRRGARTGRSSTAPGSTGTRRPSWPSGP